VGVAIVVTLLVAGAVLLMLETVLPGLVAGIAGMVCLGAAVYLGYAEHGVLTGNVVLSVVLAGVVTGTFVWVKWFPDSRMAQRFISKGQIGLQNNERTDLLHQSGTALTVLRPSGAALINGQRVDVVTEGQMLEKGRAVRVVAIEGLRVVVRAEA
jgi:membrane-bound serine protease (ClpP class)